MHCTSGLFAQTLVDRVLAVVEGTPVTLSDVRAAIGLGIATGGEEEAVQQVVDRHLLLIEVQRFPPPEPAPADIDAEAARLRGRPGIDDVMRNTGLDAVRIREVARETLRIRAYIEQRFGSTVQVSEDEVDRYYLAHQEEFLRDGLLMPFAEAEPVARQRASAERLRTMIDSWTAELRTRAEVRRPTLRLERSGQSPAN